MARSKLFDIKGNILTGLGGIGVAQTLVFFVVLCR